jgi:hypothetical protein
VTSFRVDVRPWLAAPLLVAALAAPGSAGASSIVYVKGGDIWRASPGGARKEIVVRARGATTFSAVTQDDRGRLYAVQAPSRRWLRFSASGRRVGRAFNTAGAGLRLHYDPAHNLPGFAGPVDAQASSGGDLIASWGTLQLLDHVDPAAIPPKPKYFTQDYVGLNVTRSTRDDDRAQGLPSNDLAWPSFLRDGTVIAGAFGNLLKGYGIWYFRPGGADVRFWFGPTDNTLRLANPEVTRKGDLIALTTDRDNPASMDDDVVVGHLTGPPPAAPDRDCFWASPNGTVSGLTWSPDGTTLAWTDRVGVWTARFTVPEQTGQACVVGARHLLARSATSPDWGPGG